MPVLKKTVPCAFLTGMHYLCGTILFVGSHSGGGETPGVQFFTNDINLVPVQEESQTSDVRGYFILKT